MKLNASYGSKRDELAGSRSHLHEGGSESSGAAAQHQSVVGGLLQRHVHKATERGNVRSAKTQ
jgi:hypothetical protein